MSSASRNRPVGWLPILAYHRVVGEPPEQDPAGNCVSAAIFERHLRWLADNSYTCIPLASVGRAFEAGGAMHEPLPRRSVVLTFDDGYRDNYEVAWPLLKRYGFTATIFLVSDTIGGYNSFDSDLPGEPVPMLDWEQVREMQAAGITFGSHTCTHPSSLIGLDADRLRRELTGSKAALEEGLNEPVEHFSYPHDQLDHRVEAAVEAAGYKLACAGVGSRFSRYRLTRMSPPRRTEGSLGRGLFGRRLKWSIRKNLAAVSSA